MVCNSWNHGLTYSKKYIVTDLQGILLEWECCKAELASFELCLSSCAYLLSCFSHARLESSRMIPRMRYHPLNYTSYHSAKEDSTVLSH